MPKKELEPSLFSWCPKIWGRDRAREQRFVPLLSLFTSFPHCFWMWKGNQLEEGWLHLHFRSSHQDFHLRVPWFIEVAYEWDATECDRGDRVEFIFLHSFLPFQFECLFSYIKNMNLNFLQLGQVCLSSDLCPNNIILKHSWIIRE